MHGWLYRASTAARLTRGTVLLLLDCVERKKAGVELLSNA